MPTIPVLCGTDLAGGLTGAAIYDKLKVNSVVKVT
jgi:hypothetical protein